MKLGANDTGRLFNWHPVRFALISSLAVCSFVAFNVLQSAAC